MGKHILKNNMRVNYAKSICITCIHGYTLIRIKNLFSYKFNLIMLIFIVFTIDKDPRDRTRMKRNTVHWAFCIPNSCTVHDVEKSLAETVARIRPKFQVTVRVLGHLCQTKQTVEEAKQFTTTDVIAW